MIGASPLPIPLQGLVGGLLIGVSAAIMLLGNGRIAGVSGMAARGLGVGGSAPWILASAFLVGLPAGAALVAWLSGGVAAHFPASPGFLIAGGLLVGFGTRLGSGCTSGHGVCGVSRLSQRSIAATGTFVAAGMVTVALMRLARIS